MQSILDKISEKKQHTIAQTKKKHPNFSFDDDPFPIHDFVEALIDDSAIKIIAEIKKASPSKGIIREGFSVEEIAKIYQTHGASCLSVLTEEHFFLGNPENIALARKVSSLPVLRKDFIIDAWQIDESRYLGADAILLIVALLDDGQLLDFCQHAQERGMSVLVESHTLTELERAQKLPTPLMGINNRSLHSFETDLQTSIDLSKHLNNDKFVVAESGIHHTADVQRLYEAGISRYLIGESLMKQDDVGKQLRQLLTPHA